MIVLKKLILVGWVHKPQQQMEASNFGFRWRWRDGKGCGWDGTGAIDKFGKNLALPRCCCINLRSMIRDFSENLLQRDGFSNWFLTHTKKQVPTWPVLYWKDVRFDDIRIGFFYFYSGCPNPQVFPTFQAVNKNLANGQQKSHLTYSETVPPHPTGGKMFIRKSRCNTRVSMEVSN